MSTWWYIHTETLYQFSCRWTPDDIYIPQLDINFPADEHLTIYTYRNFISTFLQINTWSRLFKRWIALCNGWISIQWIVQSVLLILIRWIVIYPMDSAIQRLNNRGLIIYTYCNFISIFLQLNTWWYIHTATLYELSCRWSPDDIYIPQLDINFPADKHVMIYTYRNFLSTFIKINTEWYIHTATLYQFACRWTLDDIYIPQLYMNFRGDEHLIYTYCNFISTFLQMVTWWYIHTATLYQFFCSWRPGDIYIRQLYINFPADEHVMIYTYRNFISTFLQMNTWWYIHTASLYELSCSWAPDDIYVRQLYINFPADKHVIIYTYRNIISTFLQMNTWWYIHTETLY